ncbi:MAG TPA: cyclase family protein [Solirubrobacteraceae bacterium]|nr:cyclase family protein [Solirubrobacteraceae bacterium]
MSEGVLTDVLDEYIERYSNWGRWGRDDQRGATNYITAEKVRAAAGLVRTGQVISLALHFDQSGPQTGANGRFNCLRYSVATGTDYATGAQRWSGEPLPRGFGFSDDTVVLHLQSATHWDSLSHIFHNGKMYNGYPAAEATTGGAPRNGAERLKSTLVGRGVLLDIPRSKGVNWLEDGYPITVDDLDAAAEHGRVEIREGDIVLLRTGQMARCLKQGWGTYAGGDAPGLSFSTIPWLAENRIVAVASDTLGGRGEAERAARQLSAEHLPGVVYMGLLLGEMFQLEELSAACADDGVHEMMISAPPLPFTGTAGAQPGPVAIR